MFESRFTKSLPGEELSDRAIVPHPVKQMAYSYVQPTPVSNPSVLLWSADMSQRLGEVFDPHKLETAEVLAGNKVLPTMRPFAARYGGHQFGVWAGQLGDGRAMVLGEVKDREGLGQELQLKGAGPTPYSRRADGRAVLRSSVREFLCSEAMHFLGVPTTRALSCALSGDQVMRDMFYDGNPDYEPGAIVCRVAPTFIRFGNFEILAAEGEHDLLRQLVEFTIANYFPHLSKGSNTSDDPTILNWFQEISERTAKLMIEWTRVGFVHGVMNTDNMSILGLTIDYGPYGWLDDFNPDWTPNTTDSENRRYRYGQQPAIGFWNLCRLAEALSPLLKEPQKLEVGIAAYQKQISEQFLQMMSQKLGVSLTGTREDHEFLEALDKWMRSTEVDFTIFYRLLMTLRQNNFNRDHLKPSFYGTPTSESLKLLEEWLHLYRTRIANESKSNDEAQTLQIMRRTNPVFTLRNYIVQYALDQLAAGDRTELDRVHLALHNPYEENELTLGYFKLRPDWAKTRAGCSMLSCSS